MAAGTLDRLVQFERCTLGDDGMSRTEVFTPHGSVVPAQKQDISDAERWRAGEVQAHVTTRFKVRFSAFTADLTPKDRLVCDGVTYQITGIKEGAGRRQWLEITCAARSDQ